MKSFIKTTFSIILIVALICMCGCSAENNYSETNSNSNAQDASKGEALDPFDGLIVQFDGISPFCTISFNNARCSENVQTYVEYSVDPYDIVTTEKHFKINDHVTVYATLKKQSSDDPAFYLTSESKEYKVENVPQYITEITDDMDLSQLKSEIQDYLDSITAFTVGNSAMGVNCYSSNTSPKLNSISFSVLKLNSYEKFNNELSYFNKINLFYSTTITAKGWNNGDFNRYFTIYAKNIVQYPDGTIGWGKDDPSTLSFESDVNAENMQSLINANITTFKADYNVTEITDILS